MALAPTPPVPKSGELIIRVQHCREDHFRGVALNIGTLDGLHDLLNLPTTSRTPTRSGGTVLYVSDLLCIYPDHVLLKGDAITLLRNLLRWFSGKGELSSLDLKEVLKLCKEFPGRCAIERLKG